MKRKPHSLLLVLSVLSIVVAVSRRLPADTGTCAGALTTVPFTDVMGNVFFCQIAEAYFSGLTNGTTPTTYSPSDSVPREQMAAFITRTQNSALRRGSRRAALKQWATPSELPVYGRSPTGDAPRLVESDGADLWVANFAGGTVTRLRGSDGRPLEQWTGAFLAFGVLVARGAIFITGQTTPGHLYIIQPRFFAGSVGTLSSTLGNGPLGITTDGTFLWTANSGGSISRVQPDTGSTTNISSGFGAPVGILYDGANLWVTDQGDNKLKKLDSNGGILLSVPVGISPEFPVFDGSNIWVPNFSSNSITVVRVRDGLVLATLTGNGLSGPVQAAFDGERILITNFTGLSVSLWKATDLTPMGLFSTGPSSPAPYGACSDGTNFWIVLSETANTLVRF